jgi:gamma-butyrobetaine dioxygenase
VTESTRQQLADLVEGLADLPYGGEAVDQRTHALQTAWYAVQAAADDELVLAAALHDIGRAAPVRAAHPHLPHELAGAAFAECHVGARAAWLIAQHVPAKRYLVATDPAYRDLLSPVSVRSLARQGGAMDALEVARFQAHPAAADAVRLRRWDDAAKDPRGPVLAVEEVLAAYDRLTGAAQPKPSAEH